ncbi:MAG: ABC transporter permease [Candidatus Promineifilaceae bacterium]|nr:ABC transporter permease [Candidatus Promineifilaceae bacterium]
MFRYILTRLLLLIPLLIGVSLITFIMINVVPGDPISTQFGMDPRGVDPETINRLREELGLNDPLPVQYLNYLKDLLRGDMGTSITTKTPVTLEIKSRLPATVQLALAAMFLVLLVSIPLGILSALHRGSIIDRLSVGVALLGVSMPSFWLGIMLMLLFSLQLGWLPSAGRGDGTLTGSLRALILPAVTLAFGLMGLSTRIMRSSMLDVLDQDYMRTAHAKGLPPRRVVFRHGLRNAFIPVLTILGIQFASLLGGTVIIETIFAWPGIGRLAVNAIFRRDYPVIMGTVLIFSVTFLLVNLIVDILYTVVDPRIRLE